MSYALITAEKENMPRVGVPYPFVLLARDLQFCRYGHAMHVNRRTLIAEFRDGPYVGQRREMGNCQLFWRPVGEAGLYVRCGEMRKQDSFSRELTPDGKAAYWAWRPDKPRSIND